MVPWVSLVVVLLGLIFFFVISGYLTTIIIIEDIAKLYIKKEKVRFFIGDVRDKERLYRALY